MQGGAVPNPVQTTSNYEIKVSDGTAATSTIGKAKKQQTNMLKLYLRSLRKRARLHGAHEATAEAGKSIRTQLVYGVFHVPDTLSALHRRELQGF